jgi:hypothetical protein
MLGNYAPVEHFTISSKPSTQEINQLMNQLKPFNLTLVGVHGSSRSPKKKFGITEEMEQIIKEIKKNHPSIVSIFANPYSLGQFPGLDNSDALIMAYENALLSQEYAAQLIFGGIDAKGKLPVTASPKYPARTGIITKKKTIKILNPN